MASELGWLLFGSILYGESVESFMLWIYYNQRKDSSRSLIPFMCQEAWTTVCVCALPRFA